MRKKISLQEALCGFNMNIKTLQKEARFVPITTEPGQVIQDKMLYRIPNEGKCSKIPYSKASRSNLRENRHFS